jgi:hypothetical protein
MGPGEPMDLGESRLLPAGKRPVMQQWYGRKGNSFGELGPRKFVDGARSWIVM